MVSVSARIVCGLAVSGLAVVLYLQSIAILSARDAWTLAGAVVAATGLGWLRIRAEERRRARHETRIESLRATNCDDSAAVLIRRQNRRRRILLGAVLVMVGLVVAQKAPELVVGRTNIRVGLALAVMGAVTILAEIFGVNIFRGGPLDMRLDPPRPLESKLATKPGPEIISKTVSKRDSKIDN